GEQPTWDLVTKNASIWWKYIIAGILYSLLVYVGFFFLIIPGIYFALKYQFFIYVLVDNNELGVFAALKESARISKGVKWKLFGFWWVALGCVILGIIALGVGIFVAMLVLGTAGAFIYDELRRQSIGVTQAQEIKP